MPQFQTFFTPARLDEFWYYVKWILFYAAPAIMIMAAAGAISLLIPVIKKVLPMKTRSTDRMRLMIMMIMKYDVIRFQLALLVK